MADKGNFLVGGQGVLSVDALSVLIIGVAFLVMLFWFKRYRDGKAGAEDSSTIMTTLGILGTFIGVSIALQALDPARIGVTLPAMLGGMKVAFGTSVLGIAFSIAIRWIEVGKRQDSLAEEGEADITALLAAQAEGIEQIRAELSSGPDGTLAQSVASIDRALTGDGDTNLLGQLRLLRQDSRDHNDALIREFKEFAANMAENSSKTLVAALEEVIRDFNVKISEQFGDNFKQLNLAVGKLVEWQDKYAEQLDQSIALLEKSATSLESSDASMAAITENSKALTESAESLKQLLQGYQSSQESLEQRLEAFAAMSEQAGEAFPKVQEQLDLLSGQVVRSLEAAEEGSRRIADETAAFKTVVQGQYGLLAEEFAGSVEEIQIAIGNGLDRVYTEIRGSVDGAVQSLGEHARSTVDAVARQTGEAQVVLSGSLESLANDSSTVAETSTRAIEEASKGLQKVSDAQTHVAEGLEEALTRTVGDMKQRLSDMADVVAGEIQQHGKRIEEELEKALVESIGSLGDQLVTINQKVAQDYEPLTKNIAELIQSVQHDGHIVNGVS